MNLPRLQFNFPTFAVGGFVRDKLIDPKSTPKDLDLVMVCESIDDVISEVERIGGETFLIKPEYLTVRCRLPELGPVDIAVARTDGNYSDGRRPDEVFLAESIEEDLSRRDARFNAIAVDLSNGNIIDPFGGINDILHRTLNAVGVARDRLEEDFLRAFRFARLSITKSFILSDEVYQAVRELNTNDFASVSTERIREEIYKMFRVDTIKSMRMLVNSFPNLGRLAFEEREIWLKPTTEKK